MEKEITLKIVSERGHDVLNLSPQMALERVKIETRENGKWAYADGKFISVDNLSMSDIQDANEIVLVSQLLGG